jgi:hypothetical protein
MDGGKLNRRCCLLNGGSVNGGKLVMEHPLT